MYTYQRYRSRNALKIGPGAGMSWLCLLKTPISETFTINFPPATIDRVLE